MKTFMGTVLVVGVMVSCSCETKTTSRPPKEDTSKLQSVEPDATTKPLASVAGTAPRVDVEKLIDTAMTKYTRGDYVGTRPIVTEVLEAYPTEERALSLLEMLNKVIGNYWRHFELKDEMTDIITHGLVLYGEGDYDIRRHNLVAPTLTLSCKSNKPSKIDARINLPNSFSTVDRSWDYKIKIKVRFDSGKMQTRRIMPGRRALYFGASLNKDLKKFDGKTLLVNYYTVEGSRTLKFNLSSTTIALSKIKELCSQPEILEKVVYRPSLPATTCCKQCTSKSKACGDSCIALGKNCTKLSGCACD